jgi:putative endonuclease
MKLYYVYILASRSRSIYIGITGNLERRLWEHRNGVGSLHARRYKEHKLVHYEIFGSVEMAIAREKQLKGWRREKKVRLIETRNPEWRELAPWKDERMSSRTE